MKNNSSLSLSLGLAALLMTACCSVVFARPPSDLPGEEVTDQQYLNFFYPRDSIQNTVPKGSPESPTWLDRAAKTWDAPTLSRQLGEDTEMLKLGMGAIFIPRMSEAELEPDIEILDGNGDVMERGKPGRKYNLVPGEYFVVMGSGPHHLRIVKNVYVQEGVVTPILPSWCGLSIEVVGEDNVPFRGEYELISLDKFELYGRGYGRNEELGEEVKTWILPAGTYKVFGVGQSYNTRTNFITVRLIPGEFTRLLLVEKQSSREIIGGGQVNTELTTELSSNWRYGADIGGSVDFSSSIDHIAPAEERSSASFRFSLLTNALLEYDREQFDWNTRLRFDEGITASMARGFDLNALEASPDELTLSSIYTWRFIPQLGPYSRLEISTDLLPDYARTSTDASEHYFFLLDTDTTLDDESLRLEVTDENYMLEPSFSPFSFEAGIGANANLLNIRSIELRVLGGIGFKQENRWNEWVIDASDSIYIDGTDESLDSEIHSRYGEYDELRKAKASNYTILRRRGNTTSRGEWGPEAAVYLLSRLGNFAFLESDLELFAPFSRIATPDVNFRGTLNWQLSKLVALVYEYAYELRRPPEEALFKSESTHRVLIRFSYTSR